jgi:hypothetical protein
VLPIPVVRYPTTDVRVAGVLVGVADVFQRVEKPHAAEHRRIEPVGDLAQLVDRFVEVLADAVELAAQRGLVGG